MRVVLICGAALLLAACECLAAITVTGAFGPGLGALGDVNHGPARPEEQETVFGPGRHPGHPLGMITGRTAVNVGFRDASFVDLTLSVDIDTFSTHLFSFNAVNNSGNTWAFINDNAVFEIHAGYGTGNSFVPHSVHEVFAEPTPLSDPPPVGLLSAGFSPPAERYSLTNLSSRSAGPEDQYFVWRNGTIRPRQVAGPLDVLIDFVPGTYEPTLRLIPRPEVVFTPIVAIAADFEPIHFPGALMSAALGINDQGVIVGQSFDPDTDPEFPDAFQLTGGTYSAVDVPGVQFFVADDVNNHGHIVGTGEDQDGVRHGYMVTPQGHMTIHFPGADWTGASGINDQGMVVGQFGSSTEPASAFLFDGNEYTRIELPQGRAIVATDINNANQVIGTFEDEMGRRRGFVTSDLSTFERIEFPGGRGTSLLSINDSGLIVGQTDIPGIDPQQDAFLFDGVFYTEINLPGVNATSAQGINNFGQIVGNYDTADGQTRGFLIDVSQLVIIPEPSALALVVAAAGIVAIAWRRVRKGFARPTRMT